MTIQEVINILSKIENKNQPLYVADTDNLYSYELVALNIFSYSTNDNLNGKAVFVADM